VKAFHDLYTAARERGAAVLLQPDLRWDRCDIKSTNLLANVLAMQAAKEAGCVEAVLYLPDGTLTEGSHSSLFGVRDGVLRTAPNSGAILPGCTRRLGFSLAGAAGIPLREQNLHRDDLATVTELFLTGTTVEVLPLVKVSGQTIGDGKPGLVARRLQEAYRSAVAAFVGPE
jgi:D-alanine transaminase